MAPTAKVDNEELRRLKEVNIDEAPARRHVRDSLKDIQQNLDHILFKVTNTSETESIRLHQWQFLGVSFVYSFTIEVGIRKVETLDPICFSIFTELDDSLIKSVGFS